jgi:RNA polymerase sigma-70 factor (ECF subfamily)
LLGSFSDADDAVQEAWLRLSRSDASEIQNIGGWLTTVVGRVCLDMLRARKSRREDVLSDELPTVRDTAPNPEEEALLADSVGMAMLVVLDTLAPAERLAFVLHDLFGVPFDDIAPILGRSPAAARQLASRGRRRVRGVDPDREVDPERQREVVDAFLAASRNADFDGLLALLDPDVVFRADPAAAQFGGVAEIRGADSVAEAFLGRAAAAQVGLLDGQIGVIVAPRGRLLLVLDVTIIDGKIVAVDAIADPGHLESMNMEVFAD